MIYTGKKDILGVLVDIIDYEAAVTLILEAAQKRNAFAVSALAVHGIMTGVLDPEQRYRLNHLDLIVPDGQPVRWALNLVHRAGLKDRVYGPTLTLSLCKCAEENDIPIYLFGSTPGVLADLQGFLKSKFPRLAIAGAEQSRFRQLTRDEKNDLVRRIRGSGAALVFVGLGCPRQEVWAFEYRQALNMPILAVGAAFDFIAGNVRQAPPWMQDHGLEWLFRLCVEPRRLWRRYLYLNPAYLSLLAFQVLGLYRPNPIGRIPTEEVFYG
jgi:N-acetylglucosaminyldiphosphoundecaprenol N-acetyl-beta-D-mannosaminyltransferase